MKMKRAKAESVTPEAIPEKGRIPVRYGLVAQGHIPTIEQMLSEEKDWSEIGLAIGWDGETARQHYEDYVATK